LKKSLYKTPIFITTTIWSIQFTKMTAVFVIVRKTTRCGESVDRSILSQVLHTAVL